MKFVNCILEKKIPNKAIINFGGNVNIASHKIINGLGLIYHKESNTAQTPEKTYSVLRKVKLRTSFNVGEKHKSTEPTEFVVLEPDWSDHYPDLILGNLWLRENNATIDMCNSSLTLNNNFVILFEKVNYEDSELSDSCSDSEQ